MPVWRSRTDFVTAMNDPDEFHRWGTEQFRTQRMTRSVMKAVKVYIAHRLGDLR